LPFERAKPVAYRESSHPAGDTAMLDDIRDHDAQATSEEEEWTRTDPVALVLKAIALAAVAVGIGASLSYVLVHEPQDARLTMKQVV
jgi:hypothetical protein